MLILDKVRADRVKAVAIVLYFCLLPREVPVSVPASRIAPSEERRTVVLARNRGLVLAAGLGFSLLFAAALLLWWRYGPLIVLDDLAAAWRCF
jgi:hypothetical protein